MNTENERFRSYDKKTCHLIQVFEGRMSASELQGVKLRQYGGEWALAVELMLAAVIHEQLKLSSDELTLLIDLARELDADESFLAPVVAMRSSSSP